MGFIQCNERGTIKDRYRKGWQGRVQTCSPILEPSTTFYITYGHLRPFIAQWLQGKEQRFNRSMAAIALSNCRFITQWLQNSGAKIHFSNRHPQTPRYKRTFHLTNLFMSTFFTLFFFYRLLRLQVSTNMLAPFY